MPSGSLPALALDCLQKSMIITPCGPRAVPAGGAGVAFMAGNCSFTVACTFFAILFLCPGAGRHSEPATAGEESLFRPRRDCQSLTLLFPPARNPIPPAS